MPIRAIFSEGVNTLTVSGLHQWDYGQKLEIHGLALPAMIEVHFACLNMTEATVRIGTTADGVTTVAIPDSCLEHDTPLRAWVYVIDTTSGKTERTIMLPIEARTKPQGADSRPPFAVDEYAEAFEQINKTVDSWRDGIVDQNDGGKTKVWTGTREEFNELTETDDHTLYVITDELPDYTDLVNMYKKALEDTAYLIEVKDGLVAVPRAKKASQDNNGRRLDFMGYFGDVFKKVTQLTEEGVYQIYAQGTRTYTDGTTETSGFSLPLVSFNGEWHAVEQRFALWGRSGDLTVILGADGTLGYDDNTWYEVTFYARKLGFSGWAAG